MTSKTAYAEALERIRSGEDTDDSNMPGYMVASDTLNVANGNESFADSAQSVAESIPRFIGLSLISGANQLYNIPADIGNLFGGDFERSNTEDVIMDLDSNLGEFYKENQEGIDLVGFIASSLIPGIGGIKVLNAGQRSLQTAIKAGKFGENTGKALGLLLPGQARGAAMAKALEEVATNSSAASLLNRNALKAVGAGFGQNALEALAFEIAITATLFNSPILENQDFGDFVMNVAFGAGVFGVLGSTVDAAKISFSLKNVADKAAVEARPWTFVPEPAAASKGYEKIALDYEVLNNIPPIPANIAPDRAAFLKAGADTTRSTLNNRIRKEFGVLAGGDQDVADTLFQAFKASNLDSQVSSMRGLLEVTKFEATSKIANRAEILSTKVDAGTASIKELDEFAESTIKVGYVKTWGEDAGMVLPEKPLVTSLVDTLKKNQVIKVTQTGVKAGVKKFPFDIKFNTGAKGGKAWNIFKADTFEANARYMWAANLKAFKPTAAKPLSVHVDDLPLMEKVMAEVPTEDLIHVQFKGLEKGESMGAQSLQEFIGARKVAIANRLLRIRGEGAEALTAKGLVQDEIAAIVNVKSSFLGGEVLRDPVSTYNLDDILALQSHAETYTKKLVDQGTRKEVDGVVDIWRVPQTIKLTYDTQPFEGINNFVIENMAIIKEQQKLYQDGTARMAANVLGDKVYEALPEINSGKIFSGAVPSGAGPGFATAESANYGTLASQFGFAGSVTSRAIKSAQDRTHDVFEPLLYKLGNNQEAAIEWSTLEARVRSIEGQYALNEAGDALEPLMILRWKAAVREANEAGTVPPKQPTLSNPAMDPRIELKSQEVRELAAAHIEVNGVRTNGLAGIRTAQGLQFNRAPEAFYPIPINPKDFPNFAIVIDESVTSGNHHRTLFASTAEELQQMAGKLKQNKQLTVLFKDEAEEYFDSIGQHSYEKTLNNNYLDVEAHRKGVSAPFIVSTDPKKIASDFLNWHLQRESGLVREAVTAKYEVQFRELEALGKNISLAKASKFGGMRQRLGIEEAVNNPFTDYIHTALAIKPTEKYPWWVWTNTMADQAVSKVLSRATDVMEKAKTTEELLVIDNMLEKAGYRGARYDDSMEIFRESVEFGNIKPARGALSTVVQKANSVMATVVLRWDMLNAANNAISANVLLGSETASLTRLINRSDLESQDAWNALTKINVPGTDQLILAPEKLIANSVRKFNRSGPEMQFYRDNGFMSSISDQYRNTIDDLTYRGDVKAWDKKIDSRHSKLRDLANKGERWTGNRLAEEFNRFVAADVMKQMTDVAVARNLMTGKEQLSYINTFVNRTQGNYLAAQRPMMFHGPIGQSIGLFQTYQFNLIQQLLRHAGEGHGKDAMTLLALQGTIHGMNGLPAFNALNTNLVGNASGNKEHRDAYDSVYGIAGKNAGDWLMYGLASNVTGLLHPDLKVNLYTRGDINPRHVTIVPTNPSSIPIIQASAKVFRNLFDTANKIAAGGDVATTLLQGLEHNGLSRPLAGLAQTLQGLENPLAASYSTSKKGNVIAANDLYSLTNLARMVGGKPLDEAIAIDASYRFKAYGLGDAKRRQVLGSAIKTTMIAGKEPTTEQIQDFALEYAELGGRQKEFNGWFTQLYKSANLSQTNKIQQSLNDPFTQSMQTIMGGKQLRDFTDD